MKWAELKPAAIDPLWDSQQGPAGVDGQNGIDGKSIVGPKGEPGADAQGFNLRGRWNRVGRYLVGDVVSIDGNSYAARQDNINKRPSSFPKLWQLLAERGHRGPEGQRGFGGMHGQDGRDGETVVVGGNASLDATFGSDTLQGMAVYVTPTGVAELAQANSPTTTGAIGFAITNAISGQLGQYQTEGQISRDDWTDVAGSAALIPGDVYYLGVDDPGKITNVSTATAGEFVVTLGRAVGLNTLDIEVQLPILLSGNVTPGTDTLSSVFDADAIVGNALYVSASGHVSLAQANAQATAGAIGLAFQDVTSGNAGDFISEGQVSRSDWTSVTGTALLNPGDVYYLSEAVPGRMTNVAPTGSDEFVVALGRAISETDFDVEVAMPIALTVGSLGGGVGGNANNAGGSNSVISATYDSDAEVGAVLYISGDGNVDLAHANNPAIGLSLEGGVAGFPGDYVVEGQITNSGWDLVANTTALVPGDTYYLDPDNPGKMTNVAPTAPGQYVQVLGHALTSTTFDLEIGEYILLTGNTSAGTTFEFVLETFTVTDPQADIQLAAIAADEFVFLNGIYQIVDEDYSISGSVITFVNGVIQIGDCVAVKYR